jgi:hypothetical protein
MELRKVGAAGASCCAGHLHVRRMPTKAAYSLVDLSLVIWSCFDCGSCPCFVAPPPPSFPGVQPPQAQLPPRNLGGGRCHRAAVRQDAGAGPVSGEDEAERAQVRSQHATLCQSPHPLPARSRASPQPGRARMPHSCWCRSLHRASSHNHHHPACAPPLRVLLFSTMTKLLDLLEVYLRWRQLPEVQQQYILLPALQGWRGQAVLEAMPGPKAGLLRLDKACHGCLPSAASACRLQLSRAPPPPATSPACSPWAAARCSTCASTAAPAWRTGAGAGGHCQGWGHADEPPSHPS